MVKIRYTGDVSPMRVKVNDAVLDRWSTGEVRDLDEVTAEKLLANQFFVKVENETLKIVEDKPTRRTYTREELYSMVKSKQVEVLKSLGLSDDKISSLKFENLRVDKILELQ